MFEKTKEVYIIESRSLFIVSTVILYVWANTVVTRQLWNAGGSRYTRSLYLQFSLHMDQKTGKTVKTVLNQIKAGIEGFGTHWV